MKDSTKPQFLILGGLLLIALVIGVVAFVLTGQDFSEGKSHLERLSQTPRTYYGDKVTLSGNVSTVIGSRSFMIEGPGVISDEVLVISRQPIVPVGGGVDDVLYHEGTRVSIQGEARRFEKEELERELGVDLVDEVYDDWEGRPVVIAESIQEER